MRRIVILFILSSIFTAALAQAPQGLNYQAVAYNASGVAVANQSIGLKLTVLDGSATGTVVYEERQNPTTDNTGLFSIVVGNGTVLSGAFNTINWGNGAKWLKTEIDITGGTSYVVAGNAQFLSVPYSLYANKARSAAGSLLMPDDLTNITPVTLVDSIPYTVPAGKNLYVTSYDFFIDSNEHIILGTGYGVINGVLLGASPGSVVRAYGSAFLVDKTVDWVTVNLVCTPITVPAGKVFVLIGLSQGMTSPVTHNLLVNGTGGGELVGSVFNSGDVISATINGEPCPTGKLSLTGYFRDKQ